MNSALKIVKFVLLAVLAIVILYGQGAEAVPGDYTYQATSSIFDTQAVLARIGKGPGGIESSGYRPPYMPPRNNGGTILGGVFRRLARINSFNRNRRQYRFI